MAFKAANRQSSGGGIVAQLNPQELKQKRKERILTTLTRLNDRDTQRFAADELLMIIRELDSETFPILLNCLCSTGPDQKMYARRECARALGFLAADACPTRFLALQNPALNKILMQLKKAMSDTDAGVRDACSEALGVIGMGLADAEGELLVGSTANPVVKVIFDALSVQSKETQACASQALLAIAPSLGTLEKDVMSLIMKMLKSPSFLSTNSLLTAFASCDPELHLPVGLVQNTVDYILPSMSTVLGQHPQGSGAGAQAGSCGILGCLGHKDWQVRKAAADAVRALALLLGPHMEAVDPVWDETNQASLCGRCIRALEACKFDKVKPVRDVVQDTLTILYELLEHGRANGGMEDWVQAVEERSHVKANLPASHSIVYNTSRPPSRQGGPGGLAAGVRSSSMIEGFKHHSVEDIIVAAPRSKSMMPVFGQRSISSQEGHEEGNGAHHGDPDMEYEDVQMHDSDDMGTPLAAASDGGEFADVVAVPQPNGQAALADLPEPEPDVSPIRTADAADEQHTDDQSRVIQISAQEWERVQSDLASLYQSQQQLMQMVLRLTEDSNASINRLQSRVSALELASAAPATLNPITTTRAPSPLRSSSSPLPPPSPSAPASVPAPHSPSASNLRASSDTPVRASRLRTSSSSLQEEMQNFSPTSPVKTTVTPTVRASSPTPRPPSAQNTPTASAAPHTPEYTTPLSSERNVSPWRERIGTGDLDGAYAEALRSQGGSPTTELKLARLLQKTGPVWSELSHETAIMLLQTFNTLIEAGTMLPRIMPWLWRLADENCAPVEVPQALKSSLLQALNNCQTGLNDDVQTQERVKLLRSTLMTVWGMKEAVRASPLSSPGGSRSLRVRNSLEGLASLQGQLDDMQRNFRSGCQSPTSPRSIRGEDPDPLN